MKQREPAGGSAVRSGGRGRDGAAASPSGGRFRWVGPGEVDPADVERVARELDLPPELSELLVRRGHADPDRVRRFLRPSFSHLHPPDLLQDMESAVDRIDGAIAGEETILVHGDYDADGMASAALLTRGLVGLGARVEGFVPHRVRDGYDLGPAGLRRAEELDADLIVTADSGVSAVEAVDRALRTGRDVVVTDHHRPPPDLPRATALVNPRRPGGAYPFPDLAGVGVAFKLLAALHARRDRPPGALNRHLDLVALGTVADVVPLVGENRTLVRAGLTAMERTRKPGLRALLRLLDLEGRELTAEAVAFRIAPRLNAVGRMADADVGLRLLLTRDPDEGASLADRLEEANRERRAEGEKVEADAWRRLQERGAPVERHCLVAWGEGWHPGVLGLAASRIAERASRPTVLVSLEGGSGRGSARSVGGFDIHRALEECADLLDRFGGHRAAAGLEVRRNNLEAMAARLEEVARRDLRPRDMTPRLHVDLVLPLGRAVELHRWMRHMAPFGEGNRRPVMISRGVRVDAPAAVGREGRHLKARLRAPDGEAEVDAIGFGMGDRLPELEGARRWEVAFELSEDEFRGRRRIQARIRDLRPAV